MFKINSDENNWRNDYPDEDDDFLATVNDSSDEDEHNDNFRFREAFLGKIL